MNVIRYILRGFKYLFLQGLIEIILILVFEYLGIEVLVDFSASNLFIENIQGVAWEILMKTILFSIVYLPIFAFISMLFFNKRKNRYLCAIINGLLSLLLSVIFLLVIRRLPLLEVTNLLLITLFASISIIGGLKALK